MPPHAREKSLGYIPSLDGLRALSIVIVMLSHFGFAKIVPGLLGVTIFFVISGYLITGLLLDESARTGRIDIRSFYIRRGIRLYPAMLAMVAVGATVYMALGGALHPSDVLSAIFYWANYHVYAEAAGPRGVTHPYLAMWSLAVEEHFYLVFPFVVLLLRNRVKTLLWLIIAVIVAVTAWRFHVAAQCGAFPAAGLCAIPMRIEHGTDTRLDSILFGSLLAVLMQTPAVGRLKRAFNNPVSLVAGILLVLATIVIRNQHFRDTLRFTVQPVGFFLIVACLIYGAAFARFANLLSHRLLLKIGRWSYSLYLWHYIVMVIGSGIVAKSLWTPISDGTALHAKHSLLLVPLLFAVSFLLAWLSYIGIEQPMVALRKRFGSHATADSAMQAKA